MATLRLVGGLLLSALVGCTPAATHLRGDAAPPPPGYNNSHASHLPAPADPAAHDPHAAPDCHLTPDQVQIAAVRESGLARALEREDEGAGKARGCLCAAGGGDPEAPLGPTLRRHAADEVRNQQASLALQAYYRLAEARGQITLAQQGRRLIDRLVRQGKELQAKGLEAPKDLPALEGERLQQAGNYLKLLQAADQLQEQLRLLVGCPGEIRPLDTFEASPEPPDVEACVARALALRPELLLLRAALHGATASNLPTLRLLLSSNNPLMGQARHICVPLLGCVSALVPHMSDAELEKIKDQLRLLLQERERQAVAEVRSAAREVNARIKIARLARQREELASRQVAALEERQRKGLEVTRDLPAARRDHLKAQSDTLSELVAREVARVKLRQSQGLLVAEVTAAGGYPPGGGESGRDCGSSTP